MVSGNNPWKSKRRTDRVEQNRNDPDRFHHSVYVILLDPKVAKLRFVAAANPKRDANKPCVYVGMTGLDPIERFENHKNGYKAASLVTQYGIKLLPDLYTCYNPMPFEAAVQMEQDLAEDLRTQGYTVTGGT